MLYSTLLRPLLFQFSPEWVHDKVLLGTSLLSQSRLACRAIHDIFARPKPIPVEFMGLKFPNPVGLAAGMDKNALAPLAWWAFGFGFMELGSVTPVGQPGNEGERMFRIPSEQALVNRMGFNNDGAEVVLARLQRQSQMGLRPPIPIGLSLGKNKLTERYVDDYVSVAKTLGPMADYLAINISSPNTTGLRGLQNPDDVSSLVDSVRRAMPNKPALVKLAPELTGDVLSFVVNAALEAGAVGIIATNTLGTKTSKGEPAGKSGRPLRELSRQRVKEIRGIIRDRGIIIGCGGIEDVPTAQAMLDAGADLIQLYSALVYEGPFLPARITRGLQLS
jgi:dihydroorotate dehydrogenase